MRNARAQLGIEQILLTGFLLFAAAIIFLYANQFMQASVEQQRIDNSLNKLVSAMQDAYLSGAGNQRVVELSWPQRLTSVDFNENRIRISFPTAGGGTTDFVALAPTNVQGTLPILEGRHLISIQSKTDGNLLILTGMTLSPETISLTLTQGQSTTQSLTLANGSAETQTGISCTVTGTISSFSSVASYPTSLASGASQSFGYDVNVGMAQTPGSYSGYVACSSSQGNSAQTAVTIVVQSLVTDTTPPVVWLEAPANGYSSPTYAVQFDYNVSDSESNVANCQLIIDGSVDQTDISITEGTTQSFNKTFASNGSHNWDVNCTDSSANANKASSVNGPRSLTINVFIDTNAPEIWLIAPLDLSTDTDGIVQFDYNAIDVNSGIARCSLIIDGNIDQNDLTVTEGITQSFSKTFTSNGTRIWDVNCVDDSNNANKASSVNGPFELTINLITYTIHSFASQIGAFGRSTTNVLGYPDNAFDAINDSNGILGGQDFNAKNLSGTISKVELLWSHTIPDSQKSVIQTTASDFNGTFNGTQTYSASGGEIGLSGGDTNWLQTTVTDFNSSGRVLTNTEIINADGGEVRLLQSSAPGGIDVSIDPATINVNYTIGKTGAGLEASQTFQPTVSSVSGVAVKINKVGAPSKDVRVAIRSSLGGANLATATILATSVTTTYQFLDANFASPVTVTPGATYYITLYTDSATGSAKYFQWGGSNANPYANGSAYQDTVNNATHDLAMRTYKPGGGTSYPSNGSFESSVFDAGTTVDWNRVYFTFNEPAGTDVNIQLATSSDGLAFSSYGTAYTASDTVTTDSNSRYLKYRLNFSTTNPSNTATVADVNITYRQPYRFYGDFNSGTVSLADDNTTLKRIDWSRSLNGQGLTLAYRLRGNLGPWGAWSADQNITAITVDQNAMFVEYRLTFTSGGQQTAYLNDINFTTQNALLNDSVSLNYGFTDWNQSTAASYTKTNTPVDKMDINVALLEIVDVTSSRPGGGSWAFNDFNTLKIAGKYSKVGNADTNWQLDTVGVRVTYQ